MGGSSICSKLAKSHHLSAEFVWLPQTPAAVPSLAVTSRRCLDFGETAPGGTKHFRAQVGVWAKEDEALSPIEHGALVGSTA